MADSITIETRYVRRFRDELTQRQRNRILDAHYGIQARIAERAGRPANLVSMVWNDRARSERVEQAIDAALVELGHLPAERPEKEEAA